MPASLLVGLKFSLCQILERVFPSGIVVQIAFLGLLTLTACMMQMEPELLCVVRLYPTSLASGGAACTREGSGGILSLLTGHPQASL